MRPNYTFNVVSADGLWVNGGYFVFRREVFEYIEAGEDLPAMFQRLIALKDRQRLEALVESGGSVWQVWETPGPAAAASG